MIKKLQFRFVLITMLSLFAVLSIIIAGMNIVSYHNVVRDADKLLDLLSENKGRFPEFGGPMHKLPQGMSPEIPFETRYFTVTLSDTGRVLAVDTGRIAAVDHDEAIRLAEHAKGGRGFVRQYRFIRCSEGDSQRLIFLDLGRRLDAFHSFLIASVSISVAGYVLMFLLVLFLSNRVVRPISDSYEKQKRFITDAGHELKTPLTIIRADADILEMEQGKNEWLTDIQKQTDRLAGLTADLVHLARLEETDRLIAAVEFPLSDVVAETAQSFLSLAQTEEKDFTAAVSPMLSMEGDSKAIAQLVSILLDNAVKYSPTGGRIRLTLEKQGKNSVLTVTNDTTAPISKKQLSQLFDRFYRGDSARASRGYGVGLSIAKAIVASHNGRLTADTPTENELRISAVFPQ